MLWKLLREKRVLRAVFDERKESIAFHVSFQVKLDFPLTFY